MASDDGDERPNQDEITGDQDLQDTLVKKRKRDTAQTSEIEIDVSLPEPPSKKSLRKAKRSKSNDDARPKSGSITNGVSATDSRSEQEQPLEIVDSTSSTSSKPKPSPYSVWIGNLPFTATKAMLRTFLTATSTDEHPRIPDETITRIHIPPPTDSRSTKGAEKPQNKGFAYVDLATEPAFASAIALSESPLGGRRLLIKSAKDFRGRPEKGDGGDGTSATNSGDKNKKPPARRIFVGNLSFDVTREDLQRHFGACGNVEDVFMATFEDSGKCKGFAWVTFDNVEAASDAVRGWTYIKSIEEEEKEVIGESDDSASDSEAQPEKNKQKKKKKSKKRKWFVNLMQGRTLRCEFAEDPETRYKKRFNKGGNATAGGRRGDWHNAAESFDGVTESAADDHPIGSKNTATKPHRRSSGPTGIQPGAPTDPTKRRGRSTQQKHQSNGSGQNNGFGLKVATGTKITFD